MAVSSQASESLTIRIFQHGWPQKHLPVLRSQNFESNTEVLQMSLGLYIINIRIKSIQAFSSTNFYCPERFLKRVLTKSTHHAKQEYTAGIVSQAPQNRIDRQHCPFFVGTKGGLKTDSHDDLGRDS